MYSNSVQCAYFSCLQLAKANILEKALNPNQLETVLSDSKSHVTILQEILKLIKSPKDSGNFAERFGKLKRWRINAIYKDHDIKEDDADSAINLANGLIYILKK